MHILSLLDDAVYGIHVYHELIRTQSARMSLFTSPGTRQ